MQSFSAGKLRKCPKCGKLKLKRAIGGGSAVIFKGSGFYQTDYRSESYKSSAKAEQEASKPASSTSSESTGKTEKKSESTTPKTDK